MKKALLVVFSVLICSTYAIAQGKCGMEKLKAMMIAKHPEFAETLKQIQQQQQLQAEAYKKLNAAEKTTAASPIPIIFHIVLNTSQIAQLGGVPGIEQRLDSQMAVINRDYNAQNGDSYKIPTGFKPLYANVGIHFGFAKLTPDGKSSPGYEIITTTASGFNFSGDPGSGMAFSGVKHASSGGADQWDPTKYINVWIINTLDGGSPSTILGMTVPTSFTASSSYGIPTDEMGVVLNYGAFGVQTAATQYYVSNITLGRTLTHELGHYFEIWHIWGDDGGLCPWNGGQDDGIADTPPQADATYGCPPFPKYDACDSTGNGIMFMNYMDYSDDDCMHLFTLDQAAVMQSNVQPGGESYSLTQHPEILAVEQVQPNNDFTISPNPTTGNLNIYFNSSTENLLSLNVINTLGQSVRQIDAKDKTKSLYTVDLSGMSKGIYFVQCNFSAGTVTRKIVLQ